MLLPDSGNDGVRAHNAVFVKAIAPVCAAKRGSVLAEQFGVPALSAVALRVEHRVVIFEPAEDASRVDALLGVQRHTIGTRRANALQHIHVVRDGCRRKAVGRGPSGIPTGPRPAIAR